MALYLYPCAVKEENPGIAFGDVGKKIGAMWADLKPEDKVGEMRWCESSA